MAKKNLLGTSVEVVAKSTTFNQANGPATSGQLRMITGILTDVDGLERKEAVKKVIAAKLTFSEASAYITLRKPEVTPVWADKAAKREAEFEARMRAKGYVKLSNIR